VKQSTWVWSVCLLQLTRAVQHLKCWRCSLAAAIECKSCLSGAECLAQSTTLMQEAFMAYPQAHLRLLLQLAPPGMTECGPVASQHCCQHCCA
jgi:hypothetical protein